MQTINRWRPLAMFVLLMLLMMAFKAHAQTDTGVLDDVTDRFQSAATKWAGAIKKGATFLFWSLALMSMVMTFGMMMLRKADISEFFVELIRFLIFTGFFFWLLDNAPAISTAILNSLKQLAGDASGTAGLTPSGIVDIGFKVFDKVISASTIRDIPASLAGMIMGAVIMCLLALVAINMVVLLISGWILAYAGIFFLGFGGAKWTSDIAINYYKTVLGIAGALMGMVLVVGIGQLFINDYFNKLATVSLREIGVMLIASLVLLILSNKIPSLISGIITGGSIGAASAMGAAGAGTLAAAGAVAGAAAAAAVTTAMSAATGAAGWGSAVSAAANAGGGAADAGSSGSGAMPDLGGGAQTTNGPTSAGTTTPLGATMGDSSGSRTAPADAAAGAEPQASEGDAAGPKAGDSAGAGAAEDGESAAAGDAPEKTGGQSALGRFASAVSAVAKGRAGSALDAARERVAQTAGGRVAAEIRSPGTASADRQNRADIARAQSVAGKAQSARAFMQTGSQSGSPPTFAGDSLSGSSASEKSVDAEAEVSAFANKTS